MGRWAQAQRRGGFVIPPVPPIDCLNVVLTPDSGGGVTTWRLTGVAGGIPPGVTGIAWEVGASDCSDSDGEAIFSALPAELITVAGDDAPVFARFAWVVGDVIQDFGCSCMQFGP